MKKASIKSKKVLIVFIILIVLVVLVGCITISRVFSKADTNALNSDNVNDFNTDLLNESNDNFMEESDNDFEDVEEDNFIEESNNDFEDVEEDNFVEDTNNDFEDAREDDFIEESDNGNIGEADDECVNDYKPDFSHIDIKKPIIYLYPQKELNLSVKLGYPEKITCSYPRYKNGWNVKAKPDGTLIDLNTGKKLYALYWEGVNTNKSDIKEGFVVKKDNMIEFLEEKLKILGLNERESEEFIIYWLPVLQEKEYAYIRFATLEEVNEKMPLEFSVEPDSLIRVLMEYKSLDNYMKVKEQKLETPKREGFVAVEWGGTELK